MCARARPRVTADPARRWAGVPHRGGGGGAAGPGPRARGAGAAAAAGGARGGGRGPRRAGAPLATVILYYIYIYIFIYIHIYTRGSDPPGRKSFCSVCSHCSACQFEKLQNGPSAVGRQGAAVSPASHNSVRTRRRLYNRFLRRLALPPSVSVSSADKPEYTASLTQQSTDETPAPRPGLKIDGRPGRFPSRPTAVLEGRSARGRTNACGPLASAVDCVSSWAEPVAHRSDGRHLATEALAALWHL